MAKSVALLLLSSLALLLLHLCSVKVSAGASNRIDPIQSSIYYLQDYCTVSENYLEEKYRHRRSYNEDDDDFGISDKIRQTVHYTKKKIKNQIKRELEIRRKWKQVFLDPLASPSVVVKLWRPDSTEQDQQHHKLVDDAATHQKVSCKLLLRLSSLNESSANQTLGLLTNSTLGAVVNFLKFNQKPWLNDYRLRIVSSDPNMTQYWLSGRKLSTASPSALQSPLPVAVDLVTHPQMHPEPLMKEELALLNKANEGGKWLLIELETINQTFNENEDENREKMSTAQKQQQQQKDNTELVISMFTRSVRSAGSALLGATQSNSAAQNGTLQCPVGTFDCAGDGEQCIPSGLRCNGEDNCGNRLEELLNCGTVNLYYIFGGDHHDEFDFESDGFWFAVRILVLLFLICLVLYMTSLLCRCCCDRGRGGHQAIINGRSPMIYVRSAKGGGPSGAEPLLATSPGRMMVKGANSSSSSAGRPASPPPSYFGNQSDNQKSNVNEYIYVNNHYNSNYGQPQGSTTVHTGVEVPVSHQGGNASAPPPFDNFASMYPKIDYPSYGSTQKQ